MAAIVLDPTIDQPNDSVTNFGEGTKTIRSSSDLLFAVALMFDCFEVN